MARARARTVVLAVRAPVSRVDADRLHDAIRRHALDRDAGLVVCQVSGPADLDLVEQLARTGLQARRSGLAVRVSSDSPPLRQLLRLCGLDDVLPALAAEPASTAAVDAPAAVCQGPSGRPREGRR